jgi:serine/threonine protein kinase
MSYESVDLEMPAFQAGATVGDFTLETVMGTGAFAKVWRVVRNDTKYALKFYTTDDDYSDLPERELLSYGLVGEHANIVNMLESVEYPYEGKSCKALLLPCAQGDLQQFLKARGAMPLQTSNDALLQVTAAVDHLHKRNLAHGDIKPENILVFLSEGSWTLKLTDFDGLLRFDDNAKTNDDCRVTSEYQAPEFILSGEYTPASDIWALGCLYYELRTDQTLFALEEENDSDDDEEDDEDDEDDEDEDELQSNVVHNDEEENDSEMKSNDSSEDDDYDEDEIELLALMVDILGPLPKYYSRKHPDILTPRGYVRQIRSHRTDLSKLLQESDLSRRDAFKAASIIRPMLAYIPSRRPKPADILTHRSLKGYFTNAVDRDQKMSEGMSSSRTTSHKKL